VITANLLHHVGDERADLGIVRGNGRHVRYLVLRQHRPRLRAQAFDGHLQAMVHSPLHGHGVEARRRQPQALPHQRLREYGRRRGAVARHVVRLRRDLLRELGAHVLKRVIQLDLAGDGHAVLGDVGGAVLLVEHDIAPPRPERHLHGVGEGIDAILQPSACSLIEEQLLRNHVSTSFSDARDAEFAAASAGIHDSASPRST
jgi:hypothetical protein